MREDDTKYQIEGLICINCGEEHCISCNDNQFPIGQPTTIKDLNKLKCENCGCKGFVRTKIMLGIAQNNNGSFGTGVILGALLG